MIYISVQKASPGIKKPPSVSADKFCICIFATHTIRHTIPYDFSFFLSKYSEYVLSGGVKRGWRWYTQVGFDSKNLKSILFHYLGTDLPGFDDARINCCRSLSSDIFLKCKKVSTVDPQGAGFGGCNQHLSPSCKQLGGVTEMSLITDSRRTIANSSMLQYSN